MINLVFGIDDDATASFIAAVTIKKAEFSKSFRSFNFPTEVIKYLEEQNKLDISKKTIPDLIFLDLQMPMMDGWEFLDMFNKEFASYFPQTRFIILSSSVDPDDASKAKKTASVLGFYQKPLKVELLNSLKNTEYLRRFFE